MPSSCAIHMSSSTIDDPFWPASLSIICSRSLGSLSLSKIAPARRAISAPLRWCALHRMATLSFQHDECAHHETRELSVQRSPRMTKTPDEQAVDEIIGRNLRAFRLRKNMSQEQVASAVNLTFQQVQKYEKGTNRISGSRMAQFCQLFNVSPNDFFKGAARLNQE